MPTFLCFSRGGSDLRLAFEGFCKRRVADCRSVISSPSVWSNTKGFMETGRGHAIPSVGNATEAFGGGAIGATIVGVGEGVGEGIETERVRL